MGWLKRRIKRRQAARARAWIAETGALRYPDGSVRLPDVELVYRPCMACGEDVLCAVDEVNPMHGGSCPIRPWHGVSGEEFETHTPYPPREWKGPSERGH